MVVELQISQGPKKSRNEKAVGWKVCPVRAATYGNRGQLAWGLPVFFTKGLIYEDVVLANAKLLCIISVFSIHSIDMIHSETSEVEYIPLFGLKLHRGGNDCSTRMEVGVPALGCIPCVVPLKSLPFWFSFNRMALS